MCFVFLQCLYFTYLHTKTPDYLHSHLALINLANNSDFGLIVHRCVLICMQVCSRSRWHRRPDFPRGGRTQRYRLRFHYHLCFMFGPGVQISHNYLNNTWKKSKESLYIGSNNKELRREGSCVVIFTKVQKSMLRLWHIGKNKVDVLLLKLDESVNLTLLES